LAYWVIEMFRTAVIFGIEYFLHWFVLLLRDNHDYQFSFSGSYNLTNQLQGNNAATMILQRLYPTIQLGRSYNFTVSVTECIPTVAPLSDPKVYYAALILHGILMLILILNDWILRFRPKIVDYFYFED